jgi:hypothetical protein
MNAGTATATVDYHKSVAYNARELAQTFVNLFTSGYEVKDREGLVKLSEFIGPIAGRSSHYFKSRPREVHDETASDLYYTLGMRFGELLRSADLTPDDSATLLESAPMIESLLKPEGMEGEAMRLRAVVRAYMNIIEGEVEHSREQAEGLAAGLVDRILRNSDNDGDAQALMQLTELLYQASRASWVEVDKLAGVIKRRAFPQTQAFEDSITEFSSLRNGVPAEDEE